MVQEDTFGLNKVQLFFVLILSIAILAFVIVVVFGTLQDSEIIGQEGASSSQTILATSVGTLSPIGTGITTSEVKANNDTWINCTTDDFVETERYDTISFWYKNATVDWTFVVNSSGTLYVNGTTGTPGAFPVYDDGANMFLCMTAAATFFNGSIDDFRGYSSSIDAELVNLTYLGGRL